MENTSSASTGHQLKIECVPFGKAPDGTEVDLYLLTNRHGLVATITNYGGIVVSLLVPDREGKLGDIVLGYDDLGGYLTASPYFGCLVGRYGNRLAKGEFKLDGKTYVLAKNDGQNHLHGGKIGFDKVVWSPRALSTEDAVALELQYSSRDGEEGYPGALSVKATYTLNDQNELIVDYLATTDKPTVVNLTHHSYFNLDGTDRDTREHLLTINANTFTPVDSGLIPTGEVRAVKGTPMDFTRPKAVGADLSAKDPQLVSGHGYDHNWILNRDAQNSKSPTLAARLVGPRSGRVMEVLTTEPAVQFYGGGHLDGTIVGKQGARYGQYHGLCLETQHYPNSPNQPEFPSTVLRPGETYQSRTVHKFSVAKE
jgi:aldose 1-epimerase